MVENLRKFESNGHFEYLPTFIEKYLGRVSTRWSKFRVRLANLFIPTWWRRISRKNKLFYLLHLLWCQARARWVEPDQQMKKQIHKLICLVTINYTSWYIHTSCFKFRVEQLENIVTPTKTKRHIIDYGLFTLWSGKTFDVSSVGERSLKLWNAITRKQAPKLPAREKERNKRKTRSTKNWKTSLAYKSMECLNWYLGLVSRVSGP